MYDLSDGDFNIYGHSSLEIFCITFTLNNLCRNICLNKKKGKKAVNVD